MTGHRRHQSPAVLQLTLAHSGRSGYSGQIQKELERSLELLEFGSTVWPGPGLERSQEGVWLYCPARGWRVCRHLAGDRTEHISPGAGLPDVKHLSVFNTWDKEWNKNLSNTEIHSDTLICTENVRDTGRLSTEMPHSLQYFFLVRTLIFHYFYNNNILFISVY